MTREEAKHLFYKINMSSVRRGEYPVESAKETIDKIYDDFESRTCENCKYNLNGIECNCNESVVEWLDTDTFPDFGCNKFERKE